MAVSELSFESESLAILPSVSVELPTNKVSDIVLRTVSYKDSLAMGLIFLEASEIGMPQGDYFPIPKFTFGVIKAASKSCFGVYFGYLGFLYMRYIFPPELLYDLCEKRVILDDSFEVEVADFKLTAAVALPHPGQF